jgi:hypothetical protein
MNVKEFQAGLKGICPACGAKVRIPLESTRPSSRQEPSATEPRASEAAAALADRAIAFDPLSPMFATPIDPLASPAAERRQDAEGRQGAERQQAAARAPAYSSAAATFAATPDLQAADPLASTENVVWYVRPPSGGQFGPATADIVRSWVAEGRVSVDTLVWREGWREWQEAANVFPQLSSPVPMTLESLLPEPIALPIHAHPPKSHLPPRKTQLIMLGSLAGVILVFIIIFLILWLKS